MASMQFIPPTKKVDFVTEAATIKVIEIFNMVDGKEVAEHKIQISYLDKYDNKKTNPDGSPVITKVVSFSDGQKSKIYGFDELPVLFPDEVGAEITLRVKSEGSTIIDFLPWNVKEVDARFVEFWKANGKDTSPIPKEKEFKWNKNDPYEPNVLQFSAIFKIEGGEFDGKLVTDYLQFSRSGISRKESHLSYDFITFPKDAAGNVGLGYEVKPDGWTGDAQFNKIHELRHCGLYDGESIPYPEDGNPLPMIEAKLQRANKLVKLEISRGYVASISTAKKVTFQPTKRVPAETGIITLTPVLDEM